MSASTPGPSLQSCLPDSLPSVCTAALGCLSPDAGLGMFFLKFQPLPPDCQNPSEFQSTHVYCQPHLPVLYDLQTFWGFKQHWHHYWHLMHSSGNWPSAGVLALVTRFGAWLPKPTFSLLHHTLIWFIPCRFVYEDIVGDRGKSLPEVQIHNFQLPPLIHQTSSLVTSKAT